MDVEVLPVSAVKTTMIRRQPTSSSSVTITPIFRTGASKRKSATPTRTAVASTAAAAAVQMEPVDLSVRHDSSDDDKDEEVGWIRAFGNISL